ncbi:hypothetical protein AX16_001714 [Volvariella volvacea WC 439]|nr:hypothetical protein AX16_001714 [Volvariella volvacea WC 439]
MDQDAFRQLLSTSKTSKQSTTSGHSSGFTYGPKSKQQDSKKPKTIDASQPAFKPRKVKSGDGAEGKYRDRAAERRGGEGNEFTAAEALLAELQKNTTDKKELEEKRQYLGGDGTHSILVKGLDMALLEQNKARQAAMTTADDEDLENAFIEVKTGGTDPSSQKEAQPQKKKSRAELIKELKEKRNAGENGVEGGKELENVKAQGKFKPIGFKPIGSSSAASGSGNAEEGKEKKKKKRVKAEGGEEKEKEKGERKKKKRKVEGEEGTTSASAPDGSRGASGGEVDAQGDVQMEDGATATTTNGTASTSKLPPPVAEPEPIDEDLDIFADAGDYDDLLSADESGSDAEEKKSREKAKDSKSSEEPPTTSLPARNWFSTEDDEEYIPRPFKPASPGPSASAPGAGSSSDPKGRGTELEEGEEQQGQNQDQEEEEQLVRLQPLASSALPSIKDFLAMDEAAEAAERKKKRKEKNKKKAGGGEEGSGSGSGSGKKVSAEVKVDRDYKRLKSYQEKKGGS